MKNKFIKFLITTSVLTMLAGCGANEINTMNNDIKVIEEEATVNEGLDNSSDEIGENSEATISISEDNMDLEEDINDIDFPVRYSLLDEGKLPAIRNQEQTNICWVFAANTVVESNAITKGFESAETIDLSEGYILAYAFDYEEDLPEDFTKDSNMFINDKKIFATNPYIVGGNSASILIKYAAGVGPVDESVAPLDLKRTDYVKSINAINEKVANGDITEDMSKYVVTDIDVLNNMEIEKQIKEKILERGAVGAGINIFYSSNGKLYEKPEKSPSANNHVTCIVGWDDEYSRDNFGIDKPINDGAWLVRDTTRAVGKDGYFWMSYENRLYGAFSANVEKRSDYGDIYVYDDLGPVDYIESKEEYTVVANVFTAKNNCNLKAAGINTYVEKQQVDILVYKNPEKGIPDSGQPVSELSVSPEYKGYHAVEFNDDISLSEGDTFSIVVKYKNGAGYGTGMAGVEGDASSMNQIINDPNRKMVMKSQPGQSYGYVVGTWYDLSSQQAADVFNYPGIINNACIRALMGP